MGSGLGRAEGGRGAVMTLSVCLVRLAAETLPLRALQG